MTTEVAALLRIFQSTLGASREQCDEPGRVLWDRIEAALTDGVKEVQPTVKAWEHSCPGYPARVLLPQGSKCAHCGATEGSSAAAPFGMEPDDHEYDELGLPSDDAPRGVGASDSEGVCTGKAK